jgi:hypothetical protein
VIDGDQDEPTDVLSGAKPLARWPILVVGIVVLFASAVWLSCQEYASGRVVSPEPPPPHAGTIEEIE